MSLVADLIHSGLEIAALKRTAKRHMDKLMQAGATLLDLFYVQSIAENLDKAKT